MSAPPIPAMQPRGIELQEPSLRHGPESGKDEEVVENVTTGRLPHAVHPRCREELGHDQRVVHGAGFREGEVERRADSLAAAAAGLARHVRAGGRIAELYRIDAKGEGASSNILAPLELIHPKEDALTEELSERRFDAISPNEVLEVSVLAPGPLEEWPVGACRMTVDRRPREREEGGLPMPEAMPKDHPGVLDRDRVAQEARKPAQEGQARRDVRQRRRPDARRPMGEMARP